MRGDSIAEPCTLGGGGLRHSHPKVGCAGCGGPCHRIGGRQQLLRAARWHAAQQAWPQAIALALQAQALGLAGAWVHAQARRTVAEQGQLALFVHWVDQLMAAGVPVSLDAQVWQAWALCFSLQHERARCAIDSLDARLLAPGGAGPGDPPLRWRLGMLRVVAWVSLDAVDAARQALQPWLLDDAPCDALALATVACGAALVALACGALHEIDSLMPRAQGAARRAASPFARAWEASVSACVQLAQADPVQADQVLRATRPEVVAAVGEGSDAVAVMDLVHARALLDLGLADAAAQAARAGLCRAHRHGVVDTVAAGLSACVALDDGRPDSPFHPLRLDAVASAYPPRLQRLLGAMRVRRLLRQGCFEAAAALARRHGLNSTAGQATELDGHGELLLARLALQAAGGPSPELDRRIGCEIKRALAQGRRRDQIELHLMACELALLDGDQACALRQLHMALRVAAAHRCMHPFVQRLPTLGPLLQHTSSRQLGLSHEDQRQLLHLLSEAGPQREAHGPSAVPLLDPLTPRELQFLSHIDQGLSNQQIADCALISVDTVKWHLRNLYSKLGVKSRSAALARSRALRLLAG
jgi:LuxR family maltose regulon positive regulatory protein